MRLVFLCSSVAHLFLRKYNMNMETLRDKGKKLGLTQAQAAVACGVSRRTYQNYEDGYLDGTTGDELYRILDEMGIMDGTNHILNVKFIKKAASEVFAKYPEVRCAYLYGSYARGEATGKSDVDILVVCHGMGLSFFGMATDLSEALHGKEIDLQTVEQIVDSEPLIENILVEGIKIYEKQHFGVKD